MAGHGLVKRGISLPRMPPVASFLAFVLAVHPDAVALLERIRVAPAPHVSTTSNSVRHHLARGKDQYLGNSGGFFTTAM